MKDPPSIWDKLATALPINRQAAIGVVGNPLGEIIKMAMNKTAYRIEQEAARAGFTKVRGGGNDRHRYAWQIKCSKCPKEFTAYWPPTVPTESMIKNMRVRSWDVGIGERPLCPDCAHPSKDKSPPKRPEHQNFKPWAPPLPKTLIAAKLVDAGVELFRKPEPPPAMPFEEYKKTITPAPSALALAGALDNVIIDKIVHRYSEYEDAKLATEKAERELLAAQRARAQIARDAKTKKAEERHARREEERKNAPPPAPPPKSIFLPTPPTPAPVENKMTAPKERPFVAPKIAHDVFMGLDAYFDSKNRLYKSGYDDSRVAKECGTTEEIVAYLRYETFGELAEDPRLGGIRAEITRLDQEMEALARNWATSIRSLQSRLDQLVNNLRR